MKKRKGAKMNSLKIRSNLVVFGLAVVLTAIAMVVLLLPKIKQKPKVQVVQQVVVQRDTIYISDPSLARQVEYWRSRALATPNVPASSPKTIRDTLTIQLVKATPTTVRMDFGRDRLTVWTVRDSTIQVHTARLNSPSGTVLVSPAGVSLVRTRPVLAPFVEVEVQSRFTATRLTSDDLAGSISAGLRVRWARIQVQAGIVGAIPEMKARWVAGMSWEWL